MDEQIKRQLSIRRQRRVRFVRRGVHDKKRLAWMWRKPKGRHNKMRRRLKAKGALPTPGYGAPRLVRGMHPSGYREVLVLNEKMLDSIDPATQAIRIAATVGGRVYGAIEKRALEMGIRILNPRKRPEETSEEIHEEAEGNTGAEESAEEVSGDE